MPSYRIAAFTTVCPRDDDPADAMTLVMAGMLGALTAVAVPSHATPLSLGSSAAR